jgi:hypothetical protein
MRERGPPSELPASFPRAGIPAPVGGIGKTLLFVVVVAGARNSAALSNPVCRPLGWPAPSGAKLLDGRE